MDDIEHLKMIELEDQLRFARRQNKELKEEVKRLKQLLNGEDVIKNSLGSCLSTAFDHLKSSHRDK